MRGCRRTSACTQHVGAVLMQITFLVIKFGQKRFSCFGSQSDSAGRFAAARLVARFPGLDRRIPETPPRCACHLHGALLAIQRLGSARLLLSTLVGVTCTANPSTDIQMHRTAMSARFRKCAHVNNGCVILLGCVVNA